ncbi:MAG: tetratricopeptide repeat protein [Phycisphaerae bacterium]
MDVDVALVGQIKDLLASRKRDDILQAVELTSRFPPPGPEPADIAAQVLHDIALYAETLGDWQLCEELYARSLSYRTVSSSIPVGSWYRRGICQERIGLYDKAVESYRKVLASRGAWPYVATMAAMRLGYLLLAAEEFAEASKTLQFVLDCLPHPEVSAAEVLFALAQCKAKMGEESAAEQCLRTLIAQNPDAEITVQAYCLLAHLSECRQNTQQAVACYRWILDSPLAPSELKVMALCRMKKLEAKSR